MSPEEQRIKIAEVCGWTDIKLMPYGAFTGNYLVPKGYKDGIGPTTVPNYLKDLNAMHEAEKILNHSQHSDFRDKLAEIVGFNDLSFIGARVYVSSTAAQRAEAFLRALNLWTE